MGSDIGSWEGIRDTCTPRAGLSLGQDLVPSQEDFRFGALPQGLSSPTARHNELGEEGRNQHTLSTCCMQSSLIMLLCFILRITPRVTSSIHILWAKHRDENPKSHSS